MGWVHIVHMDGKTTTVTIRVPVELKEALDAIAEVTERSASSLAARAVAKWVDENRWQLRAIEEGIAAADRGELVDHQAVSEWLESWGTAGELEPPR
jgi:predicted transcriptional regulator